MTTIKRVSMAVLTATAVLALASMPASAQRYCQRELYDETRDGCTAPVGGPIGTTDPSRSSTTSDGDASHVEKSETEQLLEAALDE